MNFLAYVAAVKNIFPNGKDADVYQTLIFDIVQKPSESISEYAENLKAVSKLAYSDFREKNHPPNIFTRVEKTNKGSVKILLI